MNRKVWFKKEIKRNNTKTKQNNLQDKEPTWKIKETRIIGKLRILDASIFFVFSFHSICRPRLIWQVLVIVKYTKMKFKYLSENLNVYSYFYIKHTQMYIVYFIINNILVWLWHNLLTIARNNELQQILDTTYHSRSRL